MFKFRWLLRNECDSLGGEGRSLIYDGYVIGFVLIESFTTM